MRLRLSAAVAARRQRAEGVNARSSSTPRRWLRPALRRTGRPISESSPVSAISFSNSIA